MNCDPLAKSKGKGKAKGGKGKGKGAGGKPPSVRGDTPSTGGRWRRWKSGAGVPSHWGTADDQTMDEEMNAADGAHDISTPQLQKPKSAEFDNVMAWLTEKGIDSDVIKQIKSVTADDMGAASAPPKDPWRSLQSLKARLQNTDVLLDAADKKANVLRDQLDAICDEKEDLVQKRNVLIEEIASSKAQAFETLPTQGVEEDLVTRLRSYEATISELQNLAQYGVPQSESDRKMFYSVLFHGKRSEEGPGTHAGTQQEHPDTFVDATSPQRPPPAGVDDSLRFADRTGFGFGPQGGTPNSSTLFQMCECSGGATSWKGLFWC